MGARRDPPAAPFRLLYEAHASFVARRARLGGVPDADVPDVVHEVFAALHQAMGRGLDTSAPLRGWLREVTYRIARDHRALARNEREVVGETGTIDVADAAPTAEDRMASIDVHRLVNEVLDTLPADQRIVLAMSDLDEMPMSEIAQVLEIPEGTGYSRLRAARRGFEVEWIRRRESKSAMVLPFALWAAKDLLHGAKPTPDMAGEAMEEVWRRLAGSLGPSVAAVAGGAAAAAAAKTGAMLSAKQAAIAVLAAVLVGASLHALAVRPAPPEPDAAAGSSGVPVALAVPASATSAAPVESAALAGSAAPRASVRAPTPAAGAEDEKVERAVGSPGTELEFAL